MEFIPIMHMIIIAISSVFILTTLFTKNELILSTFVSLDCMVISFIGFLTYSSLPTIYPNRKLLALGCGLLWVIPFLLDALKIKNIKIKPIFIKLSLILIFILNLLLMILL